MMDKLGNDFGIRIRFETMAALFQECFDVLVIGDDAVVYDNERMFHVGALWMRINFARYTVCCPSSVSDANMSFNRFIVGLDFCVGLNRIATI